MGAGDDRDHAAQEALLHLADAALPVAGLAGHRLAAGAGAGATAGLATHAPRHLHRARRPGEHLLEVDAHLDLQVAAGCGPARSAKAEGLVEEVEDVEVLGEARVAGAGAAEAVEVLALLRIAQHRVRLAKLLEPFLGLGPAPVDVRMPFAR